MTINELLLLNLRKILNMSFFCFVFLYFFYIFFDINMSLCCLSMGNMHSENEKDPAHRFQTMHVFSILTTNYR